MFAKLAATFLFAGVFALPYDTSSVCRELPIPITVSVPRFIFDVAVNDNWDAVSFSLNLTNRDFATPADPLPIAGVTPDAVKGTYTVGATVCGNGGPTLILTHGIIESKLYWRPTFDNSEKYNFVDAAVAAGYSVISYDRIGVGSSPKVNAYQDTQFQVQSAVLNGLIDYARDTMKATKVGLVGHSYGSYITTASASQRKVDAIVLTGFTGNFTYFAPFLAGAGFRVANIQNPSRWGSLDSSYLTSSDLYAETYAYYTSPYFEHRIARWSYGVGSEPFAAAELLSLIATNITYGNIAAPVLALQGRYDVSACGGDCVGLLGNTAALFTGAAAVETVDDLPAGHNLNLHLIAPRAFKTIFGFLKKHGV
ncbi:alpha/beta-hydrolase [Nemania sp. NC0429]|nr:alpha/beta-hydrolase [Nemania sp. NC0429]